MDDGGGGVPLVCQKKDGQYVQAGIVVACYDKDGIPLNLVADVANGVCWIDWAASCTLNPLEGRSIFGLSDLECPSWKKWEGPEKAYIVPECP